MRLVPPEVRRDDLNGFVVGEVVVFPVHDALFGRSHTETLRHVKRRRLALDVQHVDPGRLPLALCLQPERG
ncbi:hypothetical protein SFR_5435 [Streptomyces sp. FR-008]|nr:hypothetical protein SFR_5435 [Streptomyces sp. FR-008]